MSAADQFLFGYDDGHRLLTGSRELSAEVAATLLGATDAAMSDDAVPLVTGLSLSEGEYAYCVTWRASELPRRGAVWAHALIVANDALRDPRTLEVLLGLPHRPSAGAYLGRYRTPLSLEVQATAPSYLPPGPPSRDLLTLIAGATYERDGRGIVAHGDLGEGAKAIIALWRAQWPALRSAFSFRTREVAHAGSREFALTVTSKIRGADGAPLERPAQQPPWLAAVVDDAAAPQPAPLRDWLWAFGPLEPPQPRRLAALAELWLSIVARDAEAARRQLARDWPHSGATLTQVLFDGANDDWWSGEAAL